MYRSSLLLPRGLSSKPRQGKSNAQEYGALPAYTMEIPTSNIAFKSRTQARLSKLDSIANLAVSAPQHEVDAVALEGAPPSIQLVLAGNDAVPKRTIEHIQALWRYLQRLAEYYAKHHNLTETAESPPQAKRDRLPRFCSQTYHPV